ncbi:MAG: peptidoglycan DD-metalloendopeptidase family protein [Anaerolineae bacterium]
MPSKRAKEPFTLLIIPHSQRDPVSVRLPSWTLTGVLVALAAAFVGLVVFAARYHALSQEVVRLQEAQRVAQSRQQVLQQTVLSQHDAVQSMQQDFDTEIAAVQRDYNQLYREAVSFQVELTTQVKQFKTELQQIRRLSDEVRDLVGLDEGALTTSDIDIAQALGGIGAGQPRASLIDTDTPHVELAIDEILKAETNPTVQQLQGMYNVLPTWYGELQHVQDQVNARVSLVDPDKRTSPEALERQLVLWDAAPKGWPVGGRISSTFGYRVFRGRRNFHTGLDIAVWYKTPVHATEDGTVVAAGWKSGFGWTVEVLHEEGYSTLYGHLSRYLVDVGDTVKKGQTIGLSGSSGNSTGPHLHYEIRLNGIPIDPWRYATANDGK